MRRPGQPLVTYEPRLDLDVRDGWDSSIHIHEHDRTLCISVSDATALRDALTDALIQAMGRPCSTGPTCKAGGKVA